MGRGGWPSESFPCCQHAVTQRPPLDTQSWAAVTGKESWGSVGLKGLTDACERAEGPAGPCDHGCTAPTATLTSADLSQESQAAR